MAYRGQWRHGFTAFFILTVSLLGFALASSPAVAAEACDAKIPLVEAEMQDGLSDLSIAANLLEEARLGSDTGSASAQQTCGFLQNSQHAYQRARTHFAKCAEVVEAVLNHCDAPNWGDITASPELCDQRMIEIDAQLATLPQEIARFCEQ